MREGSKGRAIQGPIPGPIPAVKEPVAGELTAMPAESSAAAPIATSGAASNIASRAKSRAAPGRPRTPAIARGRIGGPLSPPESLFDLHASGAADGQRRVVAVAGGRAGPWLAHRKPAPDPQELRLPPVTELRRFNTTRLLPSKYSESVLTRLADNEEDLALIFALDNATNERLLAEGNLRLGITARELVFGVPHYRIINAAYTHPHPQGGRFSMPYRGAWYAAFELATAKAEVLFHRMLQFAEIGWTQPEELDYDQYLADFCGAFHDLRPAREATDATEADQVATQPEDEQERHERQEHQQEPPGSHAPESRESEQSAESPQSSEGVKAVAAAARRATAAAILALPVSAAVRLEAASVPGALPPPTAEEFAACLDPRSYIASQQLTLQLMEAGSLGVAYPSARRATGFCIACFRPSLVCNVRKRDLYRLTWYPDRPATFVRRARQPETPAAG